MKYDSNEQNNTLKFNNIILVNVKTFGVLSAYLYKIKIAHNVIIYFKLLSQNSNKIDIKREIPNICSLSIKCKFSFLDALVKKLIKMKKVKACINILIKLVNKVISYNPFIVTMRLTLLYFLLKVNALK